VRPSSINYRLKSAGSTQHASLLAMFNPLYSSTNQQLFEKNLEIVFVKDKEIEKIEDLRLEIQHAAEI